MAIQVQRFVFETQAWRMVRSVDSFLDVLTYIDDQTDKMGYADEQLEEFERIGMTLEPEVRKWRDVVLNLNRGGDMILRHNRPKGDTRGRMYINVRPGYVILQCSAYTGIDGDCVFGAVPYQVLRDCVRWIHAA